jgi:hypothetical protein
MTATNQNPESDSLKVNYNEETGEIQLEWDPQDPEWNWLAGLTPEEIRDMLMEQLTQTIEGGPENE